MSKNTIKQKRKLGFSVGLLVIITNVVGYSLSLLFKNLNIITDQNKYIFAYLINAFAIYVVGYTAFKLLLKKVERVENREKKKLKFMELVLFACVAIGGTQFVNVVFQMFITIIKGVFGIEIDNHVSELIQKSSPILSIMFAGIIGPLFEELIFRGTLLKRLRVYGDKTAIIYTAIMFGLFHCNIEQIPYTIACGLLFGYTYTKTNNITYPIILHMMMNMFSIILSTFYKYEMTTAVVIQGLILVVLMILALVFVPVLATKGKIKVTDRTVYSKKNLYKNIGFVFTCIAVAITTVLSQFVK